MATFASNLQPSEVDGTSLTLAAATASAIQTAYLNATVLVSVSGSVPLSGAPHGVTVTFGSSTGKAPTTPSATVGYTIPINTAQLFYLGPNRDSMKFFNLDTGNTAVVSIQPMSV